MEETLLHEVFGVSESYCCTGTEVKGSGDVSWRWSLWTSFMSARSAEVEM